MILKMLIILLVWLITNSFSAGSSGAPKDTLYEKAVNLINVAKKMDLILEE